MEEIFEKSKGSWRFKIAFSLLSLQVSSCMSLGVHVTDSMYCLDLWPNVTLYNGQRSPGSLIIFHAIKMTTVCFPVVHEFKSAGHCLFGTAKLNQGEEQRYSPGRVYTLINSLASRGWQLGKIISRAPRDVCFVGDAHIIYPVHNMVQGMCTKCLLITFEGEAGGCWLVPAMPSHGQTCPRVQWYLQPGKKSTDVSLLTPEKDQHCFTILTCTNICYSEVWERN